MPKICPKIPRNPEVGRFEPKTGGIQPRIVEKSPKIRGRGGGIGEVSQNCEVFTQNGGSPEIGEIHPKMRETPKASESTPKSRRSPENGEDSPQKRGGFTPK